ncbi:MAG TPA: hypothetical protein VJ846_01690 [Sphingomicrobium sp.]|nr:hypothetical protein [Sphingomicrobium sp.]
MAQFATWPTTVFVFGRRLIAMDKQLQDGSDTRNQRRDKKKGFA